MAKKPSWTVLYNTAETRLGTTASEFPQYVSSNRSMIDFITGGVHKEGD